MINPAWRRRALFELTLLRYREFIREPEAVFWALAFPILLAGGLGIAFRSQPVEIVHVAVVSTDLAETLRRDTHVKADLLTATEAADALRIGRVTLVAAPAPGGGVVYHYDDTNPDARVARALVDRDVQIAAGRMDPVAARDDILREPGARYIDFLVPGLIGMGIMGNGIWGLGFAIVDARRRKLMKRIVATPMPRHLYLASFLAWRMLLLPVEVGIPIGFGLLVFGVPVRGPAWQLGVLAVLGSLAFSALGLLIAARPRTIEAVAGIMNLVMMPMWIVSGIFFSADRFPEVVQPVIRALPLTALIDALRATMLQGTPLTGLVPQMAALSVYLVVCFGAALWMFRWR